MVRQVFTWRWITTFPYSLMKLWSTQATLMMLSTVSSLQHVGCSNTRNLTSTCQGRIQRSFPKITCSWKISSHRSVSFSDKVSLHCCGEEKPHQQWGNWKRLSPSVAKLQARGYSVNNSRYLAPMSFFLEHGHHCFCPSHQHQLSDISHLNQHMLKVRWKSSLCSCKKKNGNLVGFWLNGT
jgi:hypothetical protein